MKIKTLPLGRLEANCYLISTTEAAIVIDPGEYSQEVENFLLENEQKQRAILLTHSHFDHICGAKRLSDNTGVDVIIGKMDAAGLSNPDLNLAYMLGISFEPFYANRLLKDMEILEIGDLKFVCFHTPGHTQGSMCYLVNDTLFSGDTLFKQSIGRTDFPTSSVSDMMHSLVKISHLDGKISVLSGHGEPTTIADELRENPYLRYLG